MGDRASGFGHKVSSCFKFHAIDPQSLELRELTAGYERLRFGVFIQFKCIVRDLLADISAHPVFLGDDLVAFVGRVENDLILIVFDFQRQLPGRCFKTLITEIRRHCKGIGSCFHRHAIQFTRFGVKLHTGGQFALQFVSNVHLFIHVAGGDDIGIGHIFNCICQFCCADHRLDRGTAEVDHDTLLSVCRYDQIAFDLTGAIGYDTDLGQILQFPVLRGVVHSRERLQSIIIGTAYIPIIIDLDMGGIFKPD